MQLDKFENERMLVLDPPHGEFVLMNFHIGSLRHEGQIPFRVTPALSALTECVSAGAFNLRALINLRPHRVRRRGRLESAARLSWAAARS